MKRYWKDGDPWIWLTGGALAACLIFVAGLVFLITASGMGFFWPQEILRLKLADGTSVLGSTAQTEVIPHAAKTPDGRVAMRVIVPTAASGLFSAIMIGLGRAVGETMIVLMAAGNTPIMDLNPFNGF
ncbi:MAG TPA: ABC transporter permease, partial [Planctomycetota bacterium]|nr:ABC transporter permease [Planctomycetota bacterium]